MKIEVEILGRERVSIEVDEGLSLKKIAEKLGIRKNEYIPVVNGRIVTWDYIVDEEVSLRLVPVVSGG